MNNGAHFNFISYAVKLAEADEAVSAKAAEEIANLRSAWEQEDADLKLSRKSLYTNAIASADKERDLLYGVYKKSVQNQVSISVESVRKAAIVLNQHLKDYAIRPSMQMDQETGLLTNLLADLEGKYAEYVAAMSLTDLVKNMKAANEKVIASSGNRVEERKDYQRGALKTSRKATDEAYKALVEMVNSLIVSEKSTAYDDFVKSMNEEISHYKRQALGSRTRSGIPAMEASAAASSALPPRNAGESK